MTQHARPISSSSMQRCGSYTAGSSTAAGRGAATAGNDEPVTGEDLRAAMDAVIAGKRPDPNQRGSIGCNIKYRQ